MCAPPAPVRRRFAYAVFDFDGVLVDSEPLFVRATVQYVSGIGRSVSPAFLDSLYGRRTIDVVRDLAGLVELPYDDVLAARQAVVETLALTELSPAPGAVAALARLRAAGIRCAIASSSTRRLIDLLLEKFSLTDAFDHVVSGEDVANGKPDPEPYLRALDLLGATADAAVAVEDSPAGVAAARAAGLHVVHLTDGGMHIAGAADVVLTDLCGVADYVLSGSSL